MGVPVLDTSTLRLEKGQCVAREQDRLVKDPRDRQTGCQQGESLGWDNLDWQGTGWVCKCRKWDVGKEQVWVGGREGAGCVGITDQIRGNTKNLSRSILPCAAWNGTQGSGPLF